MLDWTVSIGQDTHGEVVGVDGIDTCGEVPVDVVAVVVYDL